MLSNTFLLFIAAQNSPTQPTMGQNQVIKKHFPTSEGVSEVSERANGQYSWLNIIGHSVVVIT